MEKENMLPFKSHESSVLRDALLEDQRRKLLEDIENYVGDDPLRPWIRCIKWMKDSGIKSEMLPLLEQCTKKFVNENQYRDDLRYLRVWIRYADNCSDPLQAFTFMETNNIGQRHSLFYEAYAIQLEVCKNVVKAEQMYQLGISRRAQPLEELKEMYKSFLKRQSKHQQTGIDQGSMHTSTGLFSESSHLHGPANSKPNSRVSSSQGGPMELNVFVDREFQGDAKDSRSSFGIHEKENGYQDFVGNSQGCDRNIILAFNTYGDTVSFEEVRWRIWKDRSKFIEMSSDGDNGNLCSFSGSENKAIAVNKDRALQMNGENSAYKTSKTKEELQIQETDVTSSLPLLDPWSAPIPSNNGALSSAASLDGFAKVPAEFQGDETIAIKRFAVDAIKYGIDCDNGGLEAGSHHGLVDPTINTQEAKAIIFPMFSKPLALENQRRSREASKTKPAGSTLQEGFSVFVDDDVGYENRKIGASYTSRDENLDSKPHVQPTMGDFQVYLDDDIDAKVADMYGTHIWGIETSKNNVQSSIKDTGFEVFVDDELEEAEEISRDCERKCALNYKENRQGFNCLSVQEDSLAYSQGNTKANDKGESYMETSSNSDHRGTGATVNCSAGNLVDIKVDDKTVPTSRRLNPWDENLIGELLKELKPPLTSYEGFHYTGKKYSGAISISTLKNNARNKTLQLGNTSYHIKGCTGQGAFAQVYQAEQDGYDGTIVLKVQRPPCTWEFYIYSQLDKRISSEERSSFGKVRKMHAFSDCSIMVVDYGPHGTLQDVINAYLANDQKMDEILCMYYAIEMLRMLEVLHSAGIIHGDFKPDNLLIRHESENWDEWAPNRPGCWKDQGLCLIDWGRAIDLTLLPDDVEFVGDCKTSAFQCIEMKEHRAWKFQVDTYGLCGIVHCMLHGSYMEIQQDVELDGNKSYKPKTPLKRYWNGVLWDQLFKLLLNVENCSENPPLASVRRSFEDHLIGNPTQAKKLKQLLMRQSIMMCSHK